LLELLDVDGAEGARGDGVVEVGEPVEGLLVLQDRVAFGHEQHAEL
jgi:hypothetical protein